MKRRSGMLLASLCMALFCPGSDAAEQPGHRTLSLLVTTGSSGRLVYQDLTVADLAATVSALADEARAAGHAVAVLDAGRTLVPYAESRYDRGRTMLEVLADAGCGVFAPDEMDLSSSLSFLVAQASSLPFVVLRPFAAPAGSPLGGLDDVAILRLDGGLRLAVAAVLREESLDDLAVAEAKDLEPLNPGVLSGADADIRVLIVHSGGHGRDLMTRALTWKLVESDQGLDLILDPDLGHDLVMRRERDPRPLFLVGHNRRSSQPWTVAHIVLDLERGSSGWQIDSATMKVHQAAEGAGSGSALDARVRAAMTAFRQGVSVQLPAKAPTDRGSLEEFILEAVCESANAEVAILNQGALRPVDPRYFETVPLRREAVARLLSLDQHVGVVSLRGEQIEALVKESTTRVRRDGSPRPDSLRFAGLVVSDGKIVINGRPFRGQDLYRVATNTYLLSGGDDYPILAKCDREIVTADDGRRLEIRDDIVIPRLDAAAQPFVDLHKRALWHFGVDHLRGSFDGVQTSRDPEYDDVADSRATANDSSRIAFDMRLFTERDTRRWRWENRLDARFGLLETEASGQEEIDDDLRFESTAVLTTSTLLGGGHPFAGIIVDSEIRPPENDEGVKLDRQLERSATAGLTWSGPRWTRLRLGAVARSYGDESRADRFGLIAEAEYRLEPQKGRPGLRGRVYTEGLRSGGSWIRRFDLDLRLLLPAFGDLRFEPAVNYYIYDESVLPGSAEYLRYSIGLGYSWKAKRQLGLARSKG